MKLLKIEDNKGFFIAEDGTYLPLDELTKEHLLRLVQLIFENTVEFDSFDAELLANQAHQVIYKSVYNKFTELIRGKSEFIAQSSRLYEQEFKEYQQSSENQCAGTPDSAEEEDDEAAS